jgi:hypothetical protein
VDNFQFPRWSLDMGLLRAYAGAQQPAATPNHFEIDFEGPQAGETVFVSGNPGSTDRLLTLSELLTLRDVVLPGWLLRASELRGRYIQFAKSGAEAARIVQQPLSSLENAIKVRRKLLDALLDEKLIARKEQAEEALRAKVKANPELAKRVGDAWTQIASAQWAARDLAVPYSFFEEGAGFNSRLFGYARTLVRGAAERNKPNAERLREYTETMLPRIEQEMRAAVPVYPSLERLTLSFSFERMREWLRQHPLVHEMFDDDSPETLATRLVGRTGLADPAVRMQLWGGGADAIEASKDPMIELARLVDPYARSVRRKYENEVEAPIRAASERIASARFDLMGTRVYPDATFTLRLNAGTVQGWTEGDEAIEPFTQLGGLFARATGREPFRLPQRWWNGKPQLDPGTRFNLATNNDIVGGNSGSPLLDAKGRLVGLIFDGNIHSISGAYWFDEGRNRAIAVHPAIMRAALRQIYGADALLRELEGLRLPADSSLGQGGPDFTSRTEPAEEPGSRAPPSK